MTDEFIHWFPMLGFRPALEVSRQDFAGKHGWNLHVIVAPDADLPYGSKFDGQPEPMSMFEFLLPPQVTKLYHPPAPPAQESVATSAAWVPSTFYPITGCQMWCGSVPNPPPLPEIPAVPLPGSGLLLFICIVALLIARKTGNPGR